MLALEQVEINLAPHRLYYFDTRADRHQVLRVVFDREQTLGISSIVYVLRAQAEHNLLAGIRFERRAEACRDP